MSDGLANGVCNDGNRLHMGGDDLVGNENVKGINMHWPQVAMVVYLTLSFAINFVGEKDKKRIVAGLIAAVIRTALMLVLLGFGGFWG